MLGQNKANCRVGRQYGAKRPFLTNLAYESRHLCSAARGEASNDIDILIEDYVDYKSLYELREEL